MKRYKLIILLTTITLIISITTIIYFLGFPDSYNKAGALGASAGGIISIAALFISLQSLSTINSQLNDQKETNKFHLESIGFESFLKHRDFFFSKIHSFEEKKGVKITNKDHLYSLFFPSNCITSHTKTTSLNNNKSLKATLVLYHEADQLLKSNDDAIGYLFKSLRLLSDLKVEKRIDRHGDVIYGDKNTGLNVYSIEGMHCVALSLLKNMNIFTNNEIETETISPMFEPTTYTITRFISSLSKDKKALIYIHEGQGEAALLHTAYTHLVLDNESEYDEIRKIIWEILSTQNLDLLQVPETKLRALTYLLTDLEPIDINKTELLQALSEVRRSLEAINNL